jgi:predicted outer membrane repeat protein
VTLTVNDSTFYNNNAVTGNGGAILASTLVVNNSTFYNNSAAAEGGAIWISLGSKLTIRNSTIVGNTALSTTANQEGGCGVWITGLAPTITNSIISGNTAAVKPDYSCNTSCKATPVGNLIGGDTPALSPLGYNGGSTMTMFPLRSGTGIIGAGLNSTLATDQRGVPRPTVGSDTCSLRDALNLANSHGAR